jgi:SAM-dependent MidA family methyltransferase
LGAVLEIGAAAQDLMSKIAGHLKKEPGALLLIDYGSADFAFGSTLQAVRHHRFADPLHDPGEADVTAHVGFAALSQKARQTGVAAYGPVTQGAFLASLGIFDRAARLAQKASDTQRVAIERALDRLARPGPQMGANASMAELFKVLVVASAHLQALPGFESISK